MVIESNIPQKVANLRGTGSGPRSNGDTFLQPGVTVLDDPSVDQVFGEGDIDWLIADTPRTVLIWMLPWASSYWNFNSLFDGLIGCRI